VKKKDYAKALKELQLNLTMAGQRDLSTALGQAYAAEGWDGVLRKQIEFYQKPGSSYDPAGVAELYADLGDKDRAFLWLGKAYDEHQGLVFVKAIRDFDNLRSDPRYADLLRKMGLPQ
jgi:hypothetical protein